jgi:hypothetical protein
MFWAHPPLSPVPFPAAGSGSHANPTKRFRLTSRFFLVISPEIVVGSSDVGDEIEIDRRRGAITVGSSGKTELVAAFIEEAADAGDRYES